MSRLRWFSQSFDNHQPGPKINGFSTAFTVVIIVFPPRLLAVASSFRVSAENTPALLSRTVLHRTLWTTASFLILLATSPQFTAIIPSSHPSSSLFQTHLRHLSHIFVLVQRHLPFSPVLKHRLSRSKSETEDGKYLRRLDSIADGGARFRPDTRSSVCELMEGNMEWCSIASAQARLYAC